jgi:hypothetical protein
MKTEVYFELVRRYSCLEQHKDALELFIKQNKAELETLAILDTIQTSLDQLESTLNTLSTLF